MNTFSKFSLTLLISCLCGILQAATKPGDRQEKPHATSLPERIKNEFNSGASVEPGFTENKGQVGGHDGKSHPEVKFMYSRKGTTLFLLNKGIAYQINRTHYPDGYMDLLKTGGSKTDPEKWRTLQKQISVETFRMDMILVGGDTNAEIITEGRSADFINYYGAGALDVRKYNTVTYKNVYPGIDWVLYHKNGEIKYDFIVRPGANPSLIKLQFNHHENLSLNTEGGFTLESRLGNIGEHAPVSFQNGRRINTRFVLSENIISFHLDNYDPLDLLIIDPTLLWETQYGGDQAEFGRSVSTDASGNVYLAGMTTSSVSIASGGYQNSIGSVSVPFSLANKDAFLVKFNSSGVRQWATYYGGTSEDEAYGCATDPSGNVYIAGATQSTNGIASGGFENTLLSGFAGFLVKFNTAGTRQWATYYNYCNIYACCTDVSGNVCITGYAGTQFSTLNAFQSTASSGAAFLAKFNSAGTRQFATFYGGNSGDQGQSCIADAAQNIYVAGYGSSTVGISSGGHQNIFGGGNNDAFLVKFSSTGARTWATYYGGTGEDRAWSCAVDAGNNVLLVGTTNSTVNIASGGHQNTYGGGANDGFLVKFSSSGVRQWATYYGGADDDCGIYGYASVATDALSNIYFSGITASTNNIFFQGVQTLTTNASCTFLVKFDNLGSRQWGTYYYGTAPGEWPYATTVDNSGNVYVGGVSTSNALNSNTGFQSVSGGWYDGFLVKFCSAPSRPTSVSGNASFCTGASQVYSVTSDPYATSYTWNLPAGWSGSSSTNTITGTPGSSGTLSVTLNNGCGSSNAQTLAITVNVTPTVSIAASSTVICSGASASFTASGASTYLWNTGSTNTVINLSPGATVTRTVTGTAANGCTDTAVQTLSVNASPAVSIAASSTVICSNQTVSLTASGASTYTWSNNSTTLSTANPFVTGPNASFTRTLTGTAANGCTDVAVQTISVNAAPVLTITPASTITCSGNPVTLVASGANTYTWTGGPTTAAYSPTPAATTVYTVTGQTTTSGCTDTAVQSVSVIASPTIVISASPGTVICSGTTVTLTASGTGSFLWSNGGAATNSISLTPANTVNRTVTLTAANGCTDSAVQSVSVNASPVITITPASTLICSGKTTTLTASGASTYSWAGGPNSASFTVSPAATQVYTVTGTSATGGCTDVAVQSISVNASPTINISSSSTVICSGKTATIIAANANTYTWTSGPSTAAYTINPNTTTIYTVTGTSASGGCTDTAVQTISVNASPTINIAATSTVLCSGKSATLTASNANTYTWTGGPSTAAYALNPNVTTTYTVTGTSAAGGCTNTAVQSISVNASPTINITASGTVVCAGNSVALTAGNANTYTWSGGPATAGFTVNPLSSFIYTVTGTNTSGNCTNTAVQSISVNPNPTISISVTSTVLCSGQSATLTAGNANTYTWSGGPSTALYSVSPVVTTNYTVTGTSAAGNCTNAAIQTISVNPTPTISIITTNTNICSGNTVTLTAGSASTYTWSGGPSTSNYTVNPGTNTSYTVVGTSAAGNCTGTAVQGISVNPTPTLNITASATVICSGQTVALTAGTANSYSWSGGPAASVYTVSPQSNNTYTVTGTNTAGNCTRTAVQSILVNPTPTLNITASSTVICSGKSATLSAGTANTYSWSGGPSTSGYTVAPLTTTVFTLTGTNTAGGCTNTALQTISVNITPTININASSTVVCTGKSVTLTASNANTYTWTNGPFTAGNTVSPASTSIYTVTGTNTTGNCTNTAVQSISVNLSPTITIAATGTALCSGNTSTLTANNANTYTWTGGPATAIYTISPTASTIYTVTGTSAAGNCTGSAFQTISVDPTPTVNILTSSSVICSGSSVTLTATNATTYTWTSGPASAVFIVSPNTSTSYTVTGASATGACTNTAVQSISVNVTPTISVATTNTVLCAGQSATLTAGNAATYSWTGGPTTAAYSVTPLTTTNYTVTGTSVAGNCTGFAVRSISVNSPPALTITATSTSVCAGGSATLTAFGANSYQWSNGPATQSISVSPANSSTYMVTGTAAASGCTNSSVQSITVVPGPVISIVPSSTAICPGQSATLTAFGASTYSWIGIGTGSSISVNPGSGSAYSVTGLSAGSCSGSAVQSIVVNPNPTIAISGASFVCAGTPVLLTASGAQSYTWNGSPSTNTITVTPTVSNTYSVTGTNSFNCAGTATYQVKTPSVPTPSLCLVTVDSVSLYNEIYWEKSSFPRADTFIVLRETSASVYTPLARISKNMPGLYVDTNRHAGLFNGNPNFTSYRYKIQYKDSCGTLSARSPYHQSIFIQDNQTGNFTWNYYFVEGIGAINTINYILWRENIITGAKTQVGGTGGTAFTDPSYAALALTGNVKWFVTTSGFDCDPSVRPAAGKVGTTKSNSSNERQFPATNGLNSFSNIERNISIYPNPAQNRIFVESSDISGHAEIQLTDLTGRIIQRKSLVNPRTEIETEEYSNGVYFVQITQNGNITCTSKIIIQH